MLVSPSVSSSTKPLSGARILGQDTEKWKRYGSKIKLAFNTKTMHALFFAIIIHVLLLNHGRHEKS